jgi:hypothetical protein
MTRHSARTGLRYVAACVVLLAAAGARADEPAGEWGAAVDGLACRLVLEPRYVPGQPITPVVEIKNMSDRKRYIVKTPYPYWVSSRTLGITGPNGKPIATHVPHRPDAIGEILLEPIGPGEVKRTLLSDLADSFNEFIPWQCFPERKAVPVPAGKYTAQFRFRSPKLGPRMAVAWSVENGMKVIEYKDTPPEWLADHWAGEIAAAPVAFQLEPLGKDDLVVHEWGVFTVFNDVKLANANRRQEWDSLPPYFYRQFPKERLRWVPAAWDKPIVYFYARPASLRVNVRVMFPNGVPVVWWPAAADPVDDGGHRTTTDPRTPRPFRALTWEAWLGERVPAHVGQAPFGGGPGKPSGKVADFPLPKDCWLMQARLPSATQLTVIGNIDGPPKVIFPGSKDRPETERFLYYDGLVPAPDYLRCDKVDAVSVTLHNAAKFDIGRLFVVDRRTRGAVGFASVGSEAPLKAGAHRKIAPARMAAADWPAAGVKEVRRALIEAGLFAPEADALLAIWQKRLFEADGVTVFHLLPAAEYNRMLPLSILPAPAAAPVRVGIALHPHMEIEPDLAARVAPLIRQLDDEDFETRSAASAALLEIGPFAIALLRAELQKAISLEARRRIEAVLDRVDATILLDLRAPKKAEK